MKHPTPLNRLMCVAIGSMGVSCVVYYSIFDKFHFLASIISTIHYTLIRFHYISAKKNLIEKTRS